MRLIRPQRGNILFLILLAIVLFVALNYAVMGSMNGGTKTASDDKARMAAHQIIEYAGLLKAGADFIRMNGYNDWQIDFSTTTNAAGTYGSPNTSCPDKGCWMFDPAGGKVAPRLLPPEWRDSKAVNSYPSSDKFQVTPVRVKNIGTNATDLAVIFWAIDLKICKYVNYIEGVTANLDDTFVDPSPSSYPIYKNNTAFPEIADNVNNTIGDADPRAAGRWIWCSDNSAANPNYGNFIYAVLIAR